MSKYYDYYVITYCISKHTKMGAKMDSKTNSKIPLAMPMYNQHTCMDGHYIDDLKVKNVAQK